MPRSPTQLCGRHIISRQSSARPLWPEGAESGESIELRHQPPIGGQALKSGNMGRNEESGHAPAGEENSESPGSPVNVQFYSVLTHSAIGYNL